MRSLLFIITLFFSFSSAFAASITEDILKCEANLALGKRTCDDQEAKVELKKLCEDPVDYVCSKAPPRGRYLNSACKITFYDNESAAQLVAVHQQECNFIGLPCSDQLRVLHEKDFKMIALNAAYTPERLKRLNEAFIKVKNAARSLI